MELYRSISRIVAILLFAASMVIVSIAVPYSAAPDPALSWSVRMKDAALNVVTVEGNISGRTGRKFTFFAMEPEAGGKVEPIGLEAFLRDGRHLEIDIVPEGWQVRCGGEDFTIRYDVVTTIEDRYSPEVRGMLSSLGAGRSRLMGRDIFLQPAHPVAAGVVVDFDLHEGGGLGSPWHTVGRRMIVPSVAELPMTLVAAGDYRFFQTSAGGVTLVLAIGGDWNFRDEELLETLRSIVAEEISMFDSSPREKHLVICDHNPVKGGKGFNYYGVHFGGTVLLFLDPAIDRSELFGAPMSIIAHEFFHNWNGEALRPCGPSFMWFTEGATVYFSYRVLLDAGIINGLQYDSSESAIISRYLENPLHGSVPLSLAGNSDLSDKDMVNLLYDGGFLAARAIDREITSLTGGNSGLADVIGRLYREAPEGREIGIGDLNAAILDETGADISVFIEKLLYDPLPEAPPDVSS
jgi:predicted metalloprotease with PDZ domain